MRKKMKISNEFDIQIFMLWYHLDFHVDKMRLPEHISKRVDKLLAYLENYIYVDNDAAAIVPKGSGLESSKFIRVDTYKIRADK